MKKWIEVCKTFFCLVIKEWEVNKYYNFSMVLCYNLYNEFAVFSTHQHFLWVFIISSFGAKDLIRSGLLRFASSSESKGSAKVDKYDCCFEQVYFSVSRSMLAIFPTPSQLEELWMDRGVCSGLWRIETILITSS